MSLDHRGESESHHRESKGEPERDPIPSPPEAEPRDIGWAVRSMRMGLKVRRAGWNGKNMFIFLVPGSRFAVNRPPLLGIYDEGTEINYQSHVDMRTADGSIVPWLCSQSDLLAKDWEEVF